MTSFDRYPFDRDDVELGKRIILPVSEVKDRLSERQLELIDYFEAKTGDTGLMLRKDLVPGELPRHLPSIMIIQSDVSNPGLGDLPSFGVRLQGTNLDAFYGNLKGKSAAVIEPVETRQHFYLTARMVMETRAPVLASVFGLNEDKPHVDVHVLMLPMSSAGPALDMMLAYFTITQDGKEI